MGRVVVVGSLNVDHIAHVESHAKPGETLLARDYEQQFGGKGANQAVAAAAAGADVLMVGCVGDDSVCSAPRRPRHRHHLPDSRCAQADGCGIHHGG